MDVPRLRVRMGRDRRAARGGDRICDTCEGKAPELPETGAECAIVEADGRAVFEGALRYSLNGPQLGTMDPGARRIIDAGIAAQDE